MSGTHGAAFLTFLWALAAHAPTLGVDPVCGTKHAHDTRLPSQVLNALSLDGRCAPQCCVGFP
eukprot:7691688-Alexandrium_andersonii.AAC.1